MTEDSTARAGKATPDYEKIKQKLIDQAKKAGHIDQREILNAIPDTPEHVEILDSLYTELADSNIEVTTDPATTDEFGEEWTEEEEVAVVNDQSYLDDIAD